jgi:hypothetical protein
MDNRMLAASALVPWGFPAQTLSGRVPPQGRVVLLTRLQADAHLTAPPRQLL